MSQSNFVTNKNSDENTVCFYETEHYMFSNFSAFVVEYEGISWMTSEHAYQASKFTDAEIRNEIQNAKSAYDAFKIGRSHKEQYRHDWYDIRLEIMEKIVRAKYDQHPYIQKKLIETRGKHIIEDSPLDDFWGWGSDKKGENHLGKIWMKIRDEVKE